MLPEIVEPDHHVAQHRGQIGTLLVRQRRQRRVRAGRRDVHLVRVAREVRHKRDGLAVLEQNPAAVEALGLQDILEQNAPGFGEVALARTRLGLDELEDEVGGVDLAMRMRVADADGLALVLEDEDVRDLGPRGQLAHLILPGGQQRLDAFNRQFGQRDVVARAVADDARQARGRFDAIRRGRRGQHSSGHRGPRTGDRCRRRRCRCTAGWPCR